jgi:DNA polymerase-3 subunit gamma/tau
MSSYYHTYRPQRFADLVGQDHIRKILQTAVLTQKISHAYLFCGSRGTGKTTTARLLAKLINCSNPVIQQSSKLPEPCNECDICRAISTDSCMDVTEIDAASNRGIEEIRTLQEQVRFKPQQTVKKIVIIDEVHMLTKEAFNALLKTLEEPPEYLIFILATTETHKVPATIISRCQRFDFLTPDSSVISLYLTRLAKEEGLKVEASALALIAELAAGSFRDSATLLEQLATDSQSISAAQVTEKLGLPDASLVERYVAHLGGSNDSNLTNELTIFFTRGGSASAFIDQAFHYLGRSLRNGVAIARPETVLSELTRIKYRMKQSPLAELPILVTLQANLEPAQPSVEEPAVIRVAIEQKRAVQDDVSVVEVPAEVLVQSVEAGLPAPSETVAIPVAQQVPPVELPKTDLTEIWQKSLGQLIKDDQSSMVAILRTAKPIEWDNTTLKIAVQFKFHADQLSRQKNRGILESTLTQICGKPVRIEIDIQPAEDIASLAEELAL